MAQKPAIAVRVQREDFDVAREHHLITEDRTDIGAVVCFTGLCRDESGTLAALELEHYPGMAEAELNRIALDSAGRWPICAMSIVHRVGRLAPGENIVLVVAAAEHRQAAFDAASFVMDFLKTKAPFWKRQHPVDGSDGAWVDAKASDTMAADRW